MMTSAMAPRHCPLRSTRWKERSPHTANRSITVDRLRAGVSHRVDDLKKAIAAYIHAYDKSPKPFVWTAKASEILQKVTRAKKTLDGMAQTG